jgi:biopolymer transport protein ExbD
MSEIRPRLDHYLSQTEDPRVLIAGDERARFGFTVEVLDIVREAGVKKFSVETRPRATGK